MKSKRAKGMGRRTMDYVNYEEDTDLVTRINDALRRYDMQIVPARPARVRRSRNAKARGYAVVFCSHELPLRVALDELGQALGVAIGDCRRDRRTLACGTRAGPIRVTHKYH